MIKDILDKTTESFDQFCNEEGPQYLPVQSRFWVFELVVYL